MILKAVVLKWRGSHENPAALGTGSWWGFPPCETFTMSQRIALISTETWRVSLLTVLLLSPWIGSLECVWALEYGKTRNGPLSTWVKMAFFLFLFLFSTLTLLVNQSEPKCLMQIPSELVTSVQIQIGLGKGNFPGVIPVTDRVCYHVIFWWALAWLLF